MNRERIAALVGACCDAPQTFVEQYHVHVIPLKVVYKDTEYLDGINITPGQVYQGLEKKVPKTSLPSRERITEIFDRIRAGGFQKVIAITLSSGLSGTNNMIHLIADQLEDMKVFIMDTKNTSIGDGFHAIQTTRYIEDGLSFDEIETKLMRGIDQCKVLFVVKILEYLREGGRVGLVASLFGSALSLKPIISYNDEGIYYTVAKIRGRRQSVTKIREFALDFAQGHERYNIVIIHGDAQEMAEEIRDCIVKELPGADMFTMKQVSPVLDVHTGPGTLEICVRILDEA